MSFGFGFMRECKMLEKNGRSVDGVYSVYERYEMYETSEMYETPINQKRANKGQEKKRFSDSLQMGNKTIYQKVRYRNKFYLSRNNNPLLMLPSKRSNPSSNILEGIKIDALRNP